MNSKQDKTTQRKYFCNCQFSDDNFPHDKDCPCYSIPKEKSWKVRFDRMFTEKNTKMSGRETMLFEPTTSAIKAFISRELTAAKRNIATDILKMKHDLIDITGIRREIVEKQDIINYRKTI